MSEPGTAGASGLAAVAERPKEWAPHSVDIRLSLPFFGRGLYITLVGGREKRAPDRLSEERDKYPLLTFGNLMFVMGVGTFAVLAALTMVVAQSAIIEF